VRRALIHSAVFTKWTASSRQCSQPGAVFHLTIATLAESSYPCCSLKVKQRHIMFTSAAIIKWNAAPEINKFYYTRDFLRVSENLRNIPLVRMRQLSLLSPPPHPESNTGVRPNRPSVINVIA